MLVPIIYVQTLFKIPHLLYWAASAACNKFWQILFHFFFILLMMFNEMDSLSNAMHRPLLDPAASCSPGKMAGKCHLRLELTPCPGMRRLLGPKLRRVQLTRSSLIELAGPFQRLRPIRMSPWTWSRKSQHRPEDEACCLHYSWPGEESDTKEGAPHRGPVSPGLSIWVPQSHHFLKAVRSRHNTAYKKCTICKCGAQPKPLLLNLVSTFAHLHKPDKLIAK